MTEHGIYRVYALRYAGPFLGPGALLMWLRDWEKVEERYYYIWCLQSERHVVVVDTGGSLRSWPHEGSSSTT